MLVQSDPARAHRNKAIGEFRFNLESPVPSKLPEGIQNVLLELVRLLDSSLFTWLSGEFGIKKTLN